jgi:hypothetical protein
MYIVDWVIEHAVLRLLCARHSFLCNLTQCLRHIFLYRFGAIYVLSSFRLDKTKRLTQISHHSQQMKNSFCMHCTEAKLRLKLCGYHVTYFLVDYTPLSYELVQCPRHLFFFSWISEHMMPRQRHLSPNRSILNKYYMYISAAKELKYWPGTGFTCAPSLCKSINSWGGGVANGYWTTRSALHIV